MPDHPADPTDDDLFNYDRLDRSILVQTVKKCFHTDDQGNFDRAIIGIMIGSSMMFKRLTVPFYYQRWSFWLSFVGLTVLWAVIMNLMHWPAVSYATAVVIGGLLGALILAEGVSRAVFALSQQAAIIDADAFGITLEWILEQRPDVQWVFDDLGSASLAIRRVIRRFVTHRPAGAVPPEAVAKLRARLEARRSEILL